jgi:hypothetical protein
MDELKVIESMGFTLPTPAYLIGAILFGIIGYAAYRYGKRTENSPTKWIGVALMFYPYLVSVTWMMYVVGVSLCAGLYFSRR